MSNTQSKTKSSSCQDLGNAPPQKVESLEEYHARISTPGYQTPLALNCDWDGGPFTLQEHLQVMFGEMDTALEGKPLGELVVEVLIALASNSSKEVSDLTGAVEGLANGQDRQTEESARSNDLVRDTLLTFKTIAEGDHPPRGPLPVGRGSRQSSTSRTEAPPGVKQLRRLRKGG